MNKSRELAHGMYLRRTGRKMPTNEVLEIVFQVIDHFNTLHWHDRNLLAERIEKLEQASKPS